MGKSNNRLGYHYYPDESHYSEADLETWLPILHSLGAKWLTLRSSVKRAVPESFVRGLLQANIQPIIHLASDINSVKLHDLRPLLNCYSSWGVRYLVVFDQPNMKASWGEVSWSRRGLVERFLDTMIPILEAEREAGLRPTLPPLEPGGDYWDTAFLDQVLKGLARRGKRDLLEELTLAIYAWTFNRPLDWGLGGPERWAEARPYHTPIGCQDQRGLRIFDWYASICRRILPAPLPMLVVAGGASARDPQQAPLAAELQAEQSLSIARTLDSEDDSSQVLNFCFYPLASNPDHPHQGEVWFSSDQQPKPVVSALRRYVNAPLTSSKQQAPGKHIEHYLLVPAAKDPDFHRRWSALGALAAASQAVVGFSSHEAKSARRVTIIGDEDLVPAQTEAELRAAGCEVQRVSQLIKPARAHHFQGALGQVAAMGASHV